MTNGYAETRIFENETRRNLPDFNIQTDLAIQARTLDLVLINKKIICLWVDVAVNEWIFADHTMKIKINEKID